MFVNESKPSGEPLRTKKGDPYWSVVLDTEEEGKLYNNIFNEDFLPKWKSGEKVNVDITQRGKYKNWDFGKAKNGTPYSVEPEDNSSHAGAYSIAQKNDPMDVPMPTQQVVSEKPRNESYIDPNAEGKVRHGVAIAFVERGIQLSPETKVQINEWTTYIMTGK